MNRKRVAFYFEYVSDLLLSIFFALIGLNWMLGDHSTAAKIFGLLVFIFWGVVYFQASAKHLITGE